MPSNLKNMPYNLILQQETYHKPTEQFISLGETLTHANDYKRLNSDTVTRILSVKFRIQQKYLYIQWKATHNDSWKQKLKVNHMFKFGEFSCTLAHLAVANGSLKLLKCLLEAHAYVDVKDAYGNTLLHLAAMSGNIETLNVLLEKKEAKKKINSEDNEGKTPLHYAAANGYVDVVKRLIEQDADINAAENKNGRTALHFYIMPLLMVHLSYCNIY